MEAIIYRDDIIQNCGYTLLSYDWIRPLAQWIGSRRCLEIMAGSGALSYALAQCGVDIVATDNGSWAEKWCGWFSTPWKEVEKLDCIEAVRKYSADRPLMICSWPFMDDDVYHALLEMRKVNPEAIMLYIGEGYGGATANDNFFDAVVSVDDPHFADAVKDFKQMPGIHDWPYLFR